MARQNPAFLGNKLKECWQAGDGTTVREMLVPVEPMQEASGPPIPTPTNRLIVRSPASCFPREAQQRRAAARRIRVTRAWRSQAYSIRSTRGVWCTRAIETAGAAMDSL